MEVSFKKVDLYGGAITVNVPSGFADVSTIRQVPDHQEVYLSKTGFTSLVFDLGERVSHTATDEEALRYHFDDIVDENDAKKILDIQGTGSGREAKGVVVPDLPPKTPVLTLLATTTPPPPPPRRSEPPSSPPRPASSEPEHQLQPSTATSVTILMTLIRLKPQNTDLVITLNIPQMSNGEGKSGPNENADNDVLVRGWEHEKLEQGSEMAVAAVVVEEVEEGKRIMEEVVKTLQIKDWGLFDG